MLATDWALLSCLLWMSSVSHHYKSKKALLRIPLSGESKSQRDNFQRPCRLWRLEPNGDPSSGEPNDYSAVHWLWTQLIRLGLVETVPCPNQAAQHERTRAHTHTQSLILSLKYDTFESQAPNSPTSPLKNSQKSSSPIQCLDLPPDLAQYWLVIPCSLMCPGQDRYVL